MHSSSTRILAALVAALPATLSLRAQTPAPMTYIELGRTNEVVDGRSIISIRVRPPIRPAVIAPPPVPASVAPTSAELQEEVRQAAKRHESLSVSATFYPAPVHVTELRWTSGGREWLAYSNVNFHELTQLRQIETADTVYSWFPFVSDGDAASFVRPPGLVFAGPEAEYLVYAGKAEWEATPEAFVALDWLHSYSEEHRTELASAYAVRLAEAARRAAEPPPPPKPHIVRYYVPAPVSAVEGGAK